MSWRLRLGPEIIAGSVESNTEKRLPGSVDHHSIHKRILGTDKPARQSKPIAGRLSVVRPQKLRQPRRDSIPGTQVLATVMQEGRSWIVFGSFPKNHGGWKRGACGPEFFNDLPCICQLGRFSAERQSQVCKILCTPLLLRLLQQGLHTSRKRCGHCIPVASHC